MRRLLSTTEARPAAPGSAFAVERAWRLNPQVALRDEAFGALAYHYGNRRLVFLKSRTLVTLVSVARRPSQCGAAIAALRARAQQAAYERALAAAGRLRGDRCR